MEDAAELKFLEKDGDGGRTYIIDGKGCNEFGHYIVTGEFDPRCSTVSMQRQFKPSVDSNEDIVSPSELDKFAMRGIPHYGMRVEGKFIVGGASVWYPGTIDGVHDDESDVYKIRVVYDDGKKRHEEYPCDAIRLLGSGRATSNECDGQEVIYQRGVLTQEDNQLQLVANGVLITLRGRRMK